MSGSGFTNVIWHNNHSSEEKILSENLSYNPKSIIGRGSDGTRIFDGTFSGRKVAIKRLEIENVDMGLREADLLLLGDEHENIIKLYCTKETDEFYWIAMEKCEFNLGTIFQNPTLQEECKVKDILRQITEGIRHLHAKGIRKYLFLMRIQKITK